MSIRKSVQSQNSRERPKAPSAPHRKLLNQIFTKSEVTKNIPIPKPKLMASPDGIAQNINDKDLFTAIKGLSSPKIAEKSSARNPRIYSKISIFKGRRIRPENVDSPILISRKTNGLDENYSQRPSILPRHFDIELSNHKVSKNGPVSLKEAMRDKSWL